MTVKHRHHIGSPEQRFVSQRQIQSPTGTAIRWLFSAVYERAPHSEIYKVSKARHEADTNWFPQNVCRIVGMRGSSGITRS